ncbi:hypothetical protein FB45DRAFT_923468 [Roridomyces roridus]|uniref:Uncharacterized protein n=1 Tax=Roridomyces roridus TaxID=1738132 RepID=A0AAD7BLE5_9AGAR|nr:hypothetical protein FB45DRAFT_923468 [Roridomyces roridus]
MLHFKPRIFYRATVCACLALFFLWRWVILHPVQDPLGHPTFSDIREYERGLPQHSRQAVFTKPRRRYLYLPGEASGSGWNNAFQAALLNTHLAYLTNRGYVFRDFVASAHPPFPDTLPNGDRRPLSIPMNAFTSGPTGGGQLGDDLDEQLTPRAISKEWWNKVCPANEVVEINLDETLKELNITDDTSGLDRLTRWVDKFGKMEAPCVTIPNGEPFDWMFMGNPKILELWPSYGISPVLTQFKWSPLIARALSRNYHLLTLDPHPLPPALISSYTPPRKEIPDLGSTSAPYPISSFSPYPAASSPITGLLALHVRRGDYAEHCRNLASWGSGYNAWNTFGSPDVRAAHPTLPALPDYLDVPDGMSHEDAAYAHCWPTAESIVQRARVVRKDSVSSGTQLRAVYIATNGEPHWVADLVRQFKADGWELVSTSLDMKLTRDEMAVAQAVDMSVLVAAETFIGVGFSSLSSNVVQIRLAGGRKPETTHFW